MGRIPIRVKLICEYDIMREPALSAQTCYIPTQYFCVQISYSSVDIIPNYFDKNISAIIVWTQYIGRYFDFLLDTTR